MDIDVATKRTKKDRCCQNGDYGWVEFTRNMLASFGEYTTHGSNPIRLTALTNAKLTRTAADKTMKAEKRFMATICGTV